MSPSSGLCIVPAGMTQDVETNWDTNRESVQKLITQVKIEIEDNFKVLLMGLLLQIYQIYHAGRN